MPQELLTDPGHSRADVAMTAMAIRKGWILPDIPTADGKVSILEALPKKLATIALAGKNDRAVVSAAKLLMDMKAANDKAEGIDRPAVQHQPQQTTVNIGVKIDNTADSRRDQTLAIAERIRARRISGDASG